MRQGSWEVRKGLRSKKKQEMQGCLVWGEGGRRGNTRRHAKGRPVVYMAENPAGAMLEQLVHLPDDEGSKLPDTYTMLEIVFPEELAVKELIAVAPADWRENLDITRGSGEAWLASHEAASARGPSVVAPRTWNALLNPAHPDAAKVRIEAVFQERFDIRLFRRALG